jgi:hypothetical protein
MTKTKKNLGPITQKTYIADPAYKSGIIVLLTNKSSLNDEILTLAARKGLKRGLRQAFELPG